MEKEITKLNEHLQQLKELLHVKTQVLATHMYIHVCITRTCGYVHTSRLTVVICMAKKNSLHYNYQESCLHDVAKTRKIENLNFLQLLSPGNVFN